MVFVQPYVKIAFLVDAGIAKRQTASVYLQEPGEAGHPAGRAPVAGD